MAALVCDICGGKLIVGAGGVTVCDSCGMEYSVERMREKIQEIKGVVQIDNSNMIENWTKMADRAMQACNYSEAYEYYTKIAETDPQNWRAIYGKGKAGVNLSTEENLRVQELFQGIREAVTIIKKNEIDEQEKIDVYNDMALTLKEWVEKYSRSVYNYKNCDAIAVNAERRKQVRQSFKVCVEQMEYAVTLLSDFNDEQSKENCYLCKKYLFHMIYAYCDHIIYETKDPTSPTGIRLRLDEATEKEKKPYIDEAWKISRDLKERDPDYYSDYRNYPNPSEDEWSFDVAAWWKKYAQEKYWESHRSDYESLNRERKELQGKVKALNAEIKEHPVNHQIEHLENQITLKKSEMKSLGMFKLSEKKNIQQEIDGLTVELSKKKTERDELREKLEEEKKKYEPRIDEIDFELTRNR